MIIGGWPVAFAYYLIEEPIMNLENLANKKIDQN